MARHNLILGTASGSVGDVTMYRRDGVQVNRVRVREVANPKTTTQATQRNFLAPVAKFYSPLAAVLEKSYEGLNKSKSYTAFLKKNVDLARQNGWYLPKGTPFFPLPYQVSRGTLLPLKANVDQRLGGDGYIYVPVGVTSISSADPTMGDLSQAFIAAGYQDGDQITLLVICENEGEFFPVYERFYLAIGDTRLVADVLERFSFDGVTTGHARFAPIGTDGARAAAAIVSRFENGVWRRSTEKLAVMPDILSLITSGDYAALSIASYQDNPTTHLSDVYLNGQNMVLVATAQDGTLVELEDIRETTREVGNTPISVLVALDKNGRELYLMNKIEGAEEFDKVLATTSSYVNANPTDTNVGNTVLFNTADSRVATWLKVKGVAKSVFQ